MVTSYRSNLHKIHASGHRSRALSSALGSLASLAPFVMGLVSRPLTDAQSGPDEEPADPEDEGAIAFTVPGSRTGNPPPVSLVPRLVPSN
jgi:hypothetical protein